MNKKEYAESLDRAAEEFLGAIDMTPDDRVIANSLARAMSVVITRDAVCIALKDQAEDAKLVVSSAIGLLLKLVQDHQPRRSDE